MDKLKFKAFEWPENPETFRCSFEREPIFMRDGMGLMAFAGLGPKKLTITGTGTFWGETVWADFQALQALVAADTPGALVHPQLGTFQAFLLELEVLQEPRENELSYRFTFREADENGKIPN